MMQWVRRDWQLKVVSLGLAYLSWAYVVGRSPAVRFVNAPVELVPPENAVVVDYSPREVRVRLEGDSPQINRLSEQNVYARVLLDENVRPGRAQRVPVTEREIQGLPSGVAKEILSPAVSVTLARKATRTCAVKVRLAGSPPEGHRVARAWAEPDNIEVSGPEDVIKGVEQVWTEPVDAANRKRPFTGRADLIRPDPLLTLRPEEVQFTVLVDEVPTPLEYELPVETGVDGFASDPPNVRVRLEAPPTLLDRVGRQLSAIAVPDAGPDRGGPAAIRLDFGDLAADEATKIRVISINPPRVRLRRANP